MHSPIAGGRFGVEPAALLGHSLGELVAAAVAGVFSFEDGLRLAAQRGNLMAQAPPGVMLAVTLQPDALARYFVEDVWLAAENGPRLSVASGLPSAIEELERKLSAARIPAVRLPSNNAFHTPLMTAAAKAFREKVDAVPRKAPNIPWLSNVTGTWINASEAQSPQYWATQILARVRFTKDIAVLAERPRLLLEVGPGEALIGMARQQMAKSFAAASLGAENRRKGDELIFLDAAARLWQAGVNLIWRELDPAQEVRRIPLPTYPFERERYWIEAAAPGPAAAQRATPAAAGELFVEGKRADISSWFYAPNWHSTPPASMEIGQTGKKVECWLVLLDRSGLGEAVAERLEQSGAAVISVTTGEGFTQNGRRFSVDPGECGDYERMWREIAQLELQPQGLINLWTMSGAGAQAFDSLVLLLQTGRAQRQRLYQIEIVADRLEQVMNEPVEQVERAEIFGLARVIPIEYADTQCRTVDIDLVATDLKRSVEQIASELGTPGGGLSVAYRGTTRWQKGWMSTPLPQQPVASFKPGGIYLITGGAGGIGFSIASYLLRNFQARVVLTSRTGLPGRDKWGAWLAEHKENDSVSRRIRRMEELERLGGEIVLLRADVTDRQAMSGAIEEIRRRYGKINGVVHAAGLPGGGMIAGLDLTKASEIRRPKVQGTLVLAQLLAELPEKNDLDFFLLCSSISAIAPAPGQAAYAAGNAFQNYFAVECRDTYGLPAVAIDFDAWQEVGMIAEMVLPEGFDEIKEARLRTAMSTNEGMDVVQRVLGGWSGPQILTCTVRFEPLLAKASTGNSSPEPEAVVPAAGDDHAAAIVEIWRDLLGAGEIAPTDNFFELGGHSLLGTMVLSRIRERFGVVLTLKTLFEAPTPQTLAEKIRKSPGEEPGPEPVTVAAGDREEFEI